MFNQLADTITLATVIKDLRGAQIDAEGHRQVNLAMEMVVFALLPRSLLHGRRRFHATTELLKLLPSEDTFYTQVTRAGRMRAIDLLVSAGLIEQSGEKVRVILPSL